MFDSYNLKMKYDIKKKYVGSHIEEKSKNIVLIKFSHFFSFKLCIAWPDYSLRIYKSKKLKIHPEISI